MTNVGLSVEPWEHLKAVIFVGTVRGLHLRGKTYLMQHKKLRFFSSPGLCVRYIVYAELGLSVVDNAYGFSQSPMGSGSFHLRPLPSPPITDCYCYNYITYIKRSCAIFFATWYALTEVIDLFLDLAKC